MDWINLFVQETCLICVFYIKIETKKLLPRLVFFGEIEKDLMLIYFPAISLIRNSLFSFEGQLCSFSWVLSLMGRYFYIMYIVKILKLCFSLLLRTIIYFHVYVILDFPITYRNASVLFQSECAFLHKTLNMVVFFAQSNENTYPKGSVYNALKIQH